MFTSGAALASSSTLDRGDPVRALIDPTPQELPPGEKLKLQQPIVIDGIRYTPEEFQQFAPPIIHYVVDENSEREGVIYGFKTSEELKQYLMDQGSMPAVQSANTPLSCQSFFYEHWYYGGASFSIPAGTSLNSLGSWWNDRISSVRTTCGSWTVLYEHWYFGGQRVWLGANTNWGSMGPWNDLASSLEVYW